MAARSIVALRAAEVGAIAAGILWIDYLHFYIVGRSYISENVLTSNLPLKLAGIEPLLRGTLPTWNSILGAGWPVLGDGSSAPLDWRNFFYLLFDPIPAYWVTLLVSRLIGAVCLFYYFRIRHCMRFAAALPATFVYFCGDMMMEDSRYAGVASWDLLPAYLWLVERLYERVTAGRIAAVAAHWFLMFTMGSFGVMINILPEGAVWSLALFLAGPSRNLPRFLRFVGAFIAAHVLGMAMTAVSFIPFVEFVLNSSRGDEYPTDPFALRGIFFALFGTHDQFHRLFPTFNFYLYVGVTSLPLILSAWQQREGIYARAVTWLSLAVLTFLIVMTTPVKAVLVNLLPPIAAISAIRFAPFWGFLAAFATGLALNRQAWSPTPWIRRVTAALLVLQCIPLAVLAFLAVLWAIVSVEFPDKSPAVQMDLAGLGFLVPTFLVLVGIRISGLLLELRRAPTSTTLLAAAVLVEMTTAMAIARSSFTPSHYRVTPEIAYLKEQLDDNTRMMVVYPFFAHDLDGHFSLLFDAPAAFGISSANIYDGLVVRAYADTFADFGDIEERKALYRRAYNSALVTNRASSPLMDALAVRFVAAAVPPTDTRGLVERIKGANYTIYERESYLPRAYFVACSEILDTEGVHDRLRKIAAADETAANLRKRVLLDRETIPSGLAMPGCEERYVPARIARDDYTRVTIEVDAPSDGWLVLSDTYYVGWQARANGIPVPIVRANGFARAVPVRTGRQEVVFRLDSPSVRYGAWVSGVSIMLVILLAVSQYKQRRRAA